MADGMMNFLVQEAGLQSQYKIDSAGTSAYHEGERADPRMRKTAESHGVTLESRARQVVASDFDDFDVVLAMDESNYDNLSKLALDNGKDISKLRLMREFDTFSDNKNVPDPYYGGDAGFEEVYSIVERSCKELLKQLEADQI